MRICDLYGGGDIMVISLSHSQYYQKKRSKEMRVFFFSSSSAHQPLPFIFQSFRPPQDQPPTTPSSLRHLSLSLRHSPPLTVSLSPPADAITCRSPFAPLDSSDDNHLVALRHPLPPLASPNLKVEVSFGLFGEFRGVFLEDLYYPLAFSFK